MLERYFARPATIDRIRASWIGKPIEQYVTSLADNGYAARNVFHLCRQKTAAATRLPERRPWVPFAQLIASPRGFETLLTLAEHAEFAGIRLKIVA
jgi:hypothetical protein